MSSHPPSGNGNGNGVKFGFGSFWMKVSEHRFLTTIVVLLTFGFLGYVLYLHDQGTKESMAKVIKEVEILQATQSETTYVLTLTPEERQKLDLRMPDSLRKKISGRYEHSR